LAGRNVKLLLAQGKRIKKRRGFTTEDTKSTKEGKGIKKSWLA
jgi:hypothetical protein